MSVLTPIERALDDLKSAIHNLASKTEGTNFHGDVQNIVQKVEADVTPALQETKANLERDAQNLERAGGQAAGDAERQSVEDAEAEAQRIAEHVRAQFEEAQNAGPGSPHPTDTGVDWSNRQAAPPVAGPGQTASGDVVGQPVQPVGGQQVPGAVPVTQAAPQTQVAEQGQVGAEGQVQGQPQQGQVAADQQAGSPAEQQAQQDAARQDEPNA